MAQRGKPSIAHEYDKREQCIHCGMYRNNVERLNHVCKPWRENEVDQKAADDSKMSLEDYRRGAQTA